MSEVRVENNWVAQYLAGWANQIAARYGHPVYLVGSALVEEKPRDVDIVVILPDEEFTNRFGPWPETQMLGPIVTEGAKRWAAECGKLARWVTKYHPAVNVDFKVESDDWAALKYTGKPKLRIDSVPFEKPP